MINGIQAQQHGIVAAAAPTIGTDAYCEYNLGGTNNGGPLVRLRWNTAATYAAGFESYRLYQNGVLVATNTTDAAYPWVMGQPLTLTPGTSYSFYARVYDQLGRYAQTNTVTVVAASQTVPTAPATKTVHWYGGTEPSVQVYYATAADNSGLGIQSVQMTLYNISYTVYLNESNATPAGALSTTTGQWLFNRSQIPAGNYTLQIQVTDKSNNTIFSSAAVTCN